MISSDNISGGGGRKTPAVWTVEKIFKYPSLCIALAYLVEFWLNMYEYPSKNGKSSDSFDSFIPLYYNLKKLGQRNRECRRDTESIGKQGLYMLP